MPTTRALCVAGSDAARAARDAGDRRRRHARRAQLPALRPLRALRAPTSTTRLRALADFVIDRHYPELPRSERSAATPTPRCWKWSAPHRRADRALAGGRLLPRRDEHRQHVHPRPDDRLRPVRLPRRLRPGHICNHTDTAAATPSPAAQVGHWNLLRAGPGAAAADRRRRRSRIAALDVYQAVFADEIRRAHARQAGPDASARRRRPRAVRRPAHAAGAGQHVDFTIFFRALGARSMAAGARPSRCATCSSTAPPSTPGARYCRAPRERSPRRTPSASCDGCSQPRNTSCAITWRKQAIEKAQKKDFSELRTLLALLKPLRRTAGHEPSRLSRPTGPATSKSAAHHDRQPSQKTDAEWNALLAESAERGAFEVTRHAATERAFTGKFGTTTSTASTPASAATRRCSSPTPSSIPAAAGPAIPRTLDPANVTKNPTARTAWCAPRSSAPSATPIWATCSRTARRHRPALLHQLGLARLQEALSPTDHP